MSGILVFVVQLFLRSGCNMALVFISGDSPENVEWTEHLMEIDSITIKQAKYCKEIYQCQT